MTPEPLPLRVGATVAAMVLATAVGGLLMGSCARALATTAHGNLVVIAGFVGLWMLTTDIIFAANQQWMGRNLEERTERFVLCAVLALPVQLFVVTAGINVFEALGGRH